ncbi:MAG: response regulator [Gemmatimonadetes bacterium]|nr:response regulator [Gemmatimonadota bacterium]
MRLSDAMSGGAVFEVYMPKARGEPVATPRPEAQAPPRGRETILLVDDYEALRKTVARVLQESGFRVLEAGTAAEALAILERRNERVDLLISDLVLPDLSGFELEARALRRLPNLVTVFISGYLDGVTSLRISESATILEKPFSPEVLTFTVRRVLDERKRFTG